MTSLFVFSQMSVKYAAFLISFIISYFYITDIIYYLNSISLKAFPRQKDMLAIMSFKRIFRNSYPTL